VHWLSILSNINSDRRPETNKKPSLYFILASCSQPVDGIKRQGCAYVLLASKATNDDVAEVQPENEKTNGWLRWHD